MRDHGCSFHKLMFALRREHPTADCSDVGPHRPQTQGYLRGSLEQLFYAVMRGGATSLQSAVGVGQELCIMLAVNFGELRVCELRRMPKRRSSAPVRRARPQRDHNTSSTIIGVLCTWGYVLA